MIFNFENQSMRNVFFAFFVLISGTSAAQTLKTIKNSEIKTVRVYQNGAQVNRSVQTTVEAGITQLLIPNLSSSISKSTIAVSGIADATLLSVVHQLNSLEEEMKTPELKNMEDSLLLLMKDKDKATSLQEVFLEEITLLKANKSVGGANVGVDPDNLKEIADFFRERMIELKVKLLDLEKEQTSLDERIAKVSRHIGELNAKNDVPSIIIIIAVSAKSRMNLNLNLTYFVSGAGWTPKYDIRATDIKNPVLLAYKADILQNTGEEWKDVKLTLSTGNPSLSGNKPELLPWYHEYSDKTNINLTNQVPANYELQELQISTRKSDATAYQWDAVVVEQNQLSTDFEIQIPYTIPSDGKQYTVDIQSYELPASFTYFAVPKKDKDAFLIAKITGWESLNLLAGKSNVYFEGSFVGESSINPRSTNDTLDLSLGRDKKIVILREKQKELSSSKFVGGNVVKELNYEISVRNGKKESIQIVIEDQVPISKNGDIKVNVQENSSGNYSEETGKVMWKMDIPPGATEKRKLNFTVKYPKEKVIVGL